MALQPFINIDRDYGYGRGYNTFGEDPFLTGEIGAAEVEGIQSQGVMSQAKHFIAYDTDATNVFVDDQTAPQGLSGATSQLSARGGRHLVGRQPPITGSTAHISLRHDVII